MAQDAPPAFLSYCREDSDFALRLAGDLKAAGASVWLDQLDIIPGERWDRAVEDALASCPRMLVILSPASVNSTNVMDEVSFALEEKKTVIPVIYKDCTIPFRLRRVQYVDFRQDYARGLKELLKILAPKPTAGPSTPADPDIASQTGVAEAHERKVPTAEEGRNAVASEGQAAEQALLGQERTQAEQAQLEQERRRAAEQAWLEVEAGKVEEQAQREQGRKAAEHVRLEQERVQGPPEGASEASPGGASPATNRRRTDRCPQLNRGGLLISA